MKRIGFVNIAINIPKVRALLESKPKMYLVISKVIIKVDINIEERNDISANTLLFKK